MIRRVERHDLPALLDLCARHAAYEALPFREDGQIERWREALFGDAPALFAWVADADSDGYDAYMTATIDYSTWSARPFVHLDCLYLRDEARGQGLGRCFMEVLIGFAQGRGITELQWHTVPANTAGVGFYHAMGARSLPKVRFALDVGARAVA